MQVAGHEKPFSYEKVGDTCCFESAKYHASGHVTNNTEKIAFFFARNKAGSLANKGETTDDPVLLSDGENDDDGGGQHTANNKKQRTSGD